MKSFLSISLSNFLQNAKLQVLGFFLLCENQAKAFTYKWVTHCIFLWRSQLKTTSTLYAKESKRYHTLLYDNVTHYHNKIIEVNTQGKWVFWFKQTIFQDHPTPASLFSTGSFWKASGNYKTDFHPSNAIVSHAGQVRAACSNRHLGSGTGTKWNDFPSSRSKYQRCQDPDARFQHN